MTRRRPGKRVRRAFYVVLLAAVLGLTLSFWPWVDAQARAVVVISSVLDAPVLTPLVTAISGDPRLSDTRVSGYPSLVAKPAGEGPWPAVFVVNGAVPEGRKLPAVRRLAKGFARAGYLAVVPDLPGLTEDRITPRTVDAATEAAGAISARPDADDRKVALVGVSTGATLALLAAEDPSLEGKVSLVAGVAPFSNIKTVLSVATTAHYRHPDGGLVRYRADPFLSYVAARSLIGALPRGADSRTLSDEISGVDREHPDPLHDLRQRPTDDLGPRAKSVVRLLANRNPERFDDLYAALPEGIVHELEELSPHAAEEAYLVMREAVRNAVAHSGCGRIDVGLEIDDAELKGHVRDDGTGFDGSESPGQGQSDQEDDGYAEGVGLRSMKERTGQLGGRLEVHSEPGVGTTVEVRVPLVG